MDKSYSIWFTPDDIQTLAKIMDLAIRAGGLEAARTAWPVMTKIDAAIRAGAAEPQGEPQA